MPKIRVLLVDDEKEYIETMAERLRMRDFEVAVATSGDEAVERLNRAGPGPTPALRPTPAPRPQARPRPQLQPQLQPKVRVLLVDDEVEFVATLAERLRMRGFDVDVATSGRQAIEKATAVSFQAVVVDYAMPMMDGIETIKELRGLDAAIPFMLLSGEATIKAAIEAARLGAVDVLEKPVDISTIAEKIQQTCVHSPR